MKKIDEKEMPKKPPKTKTKTGKDGKEQGERQKS